MNTLIIVDMQNDFLEGGALEVPKSNNIIPIVNNCIEKFTTCVYTQDWHPKDHLSFASNHENKNVYDFVELKGIDQILWPDHCVENTFGSEIHKDVIVKNESKIFTKGSDKEIDSYSGFFDNGKLQSTGLDNYLKQIAAEKIFICGLATDYCVKFTAIDSKQLGYDTYVIADATAAVNVKPEDYQNSLSEMESLGINIIDSKKIESYL